MVGRIVAIADVYDALTHDRPYKAAWTPEQAIEEIASQSGRQFDPAVVEMFLALHRREAISARVTSRESRSRPAAVETTRRSRPAQVAAGRAHSTGARQR
jgi:putative two-component system response regulator